MTERAGSVSVVIPTRNRKEELLRAVESARSQSWPPREIIIVDDMSNFSVKELIRRQFRNEITVITNSIGLGASKSRNIGAAQATGDFLAFLDSDDYWEPTKIEKQLSLFQERRKLSLVYCDQWRVDESGRRSESGKTLVDNNILEHLVAGWTAPNTSTLVFRREAFLELGGFDDRLSSCQDHDVWMRLGQQEIPVGFHPEKLSYFSSGSPIRITSDYLRRLEGMEFFLAKWKGAIEEAFGKASYKKFRSDYIAKVAYPLAAACLREGSISRAGTILIKHLLIRKAFYIRLIGTCRQKVRGRRDDALR